MPVASAKLPMVRPSRPRRLAIFSASSRIAVRVCSPLVGLSTGGRIVRTFGSVNRPPLEGLAQVAAGVAGRVLRYLLGRAFRHQAAAAITAFRAEVDQPVGGL